MKKKISKNEKHPNTIRVQLGLYYGTFLFLLLFVIAIVTFFLVTKVEADNIRNYGESLLWQTSDSVESELKKYEVGINIVNNNALLQWYMQEDHSKDNGKKTISVWRQNDVFNVLMDITNTIGDVDSIGVFMEDGAGGYFFGNNSSKEVTDEYLEFVESEFQKIEENRGMLHWAGSVEFQETQTILCMRNVIDNQNLDRLGGLVFNVNQKWLEQVLRKTELGKGKAVFITNEDNRMVAASNPELFELWEKEYTVDNDYGQKEIICDGKKYLMVSCELEGTNWNMVGLIPLKTLQNQLLLTRSILIVIDILGILISILITILIARHLARPIERLRSSMQKVSTRRVLDVVYEDNTCYETQELGRSFVKMVHDIDELMIKNRESELREKEAQLSALQAQINPHFLYNTLNTIHYMLILEDKPEIGKLVVNLGDLLRNSIEKARGLITLEEELSLVEKYLYIQKVRFEEKLQYEIQVSEEARACLVIRLLLQPLVENSIIHGFEKQGGTIFIRGYIDAEAGHLILVVEDNGQGISREKIETLLMEKPVEKGKRRHIGVANVNKRIQLSYGSEYGIQIQSRESLGTRIQIEMPAQGERIYEDEDSDR